jgi:hypothetical protein
MAEFDNRGPQGVQGIPGPPGPVYVANDNITRDEFKSEIGRVEGVLGTQIGAVEKTLNAKLGNLKAWGIAALVGGQAMAGVLAAIIPHQLAHTAHTALHVLHIV